VCHDVLQDPTFFRFLSRIDREFAAEAQAGRCPGCSGPLHVSDYPRKPRGCPAVVREEYSRRLSFTCGRCDARSTSPSVRLLAARVPGGGVDAEVTGGQRVGPGAVRSVQHPARTLKRWRSWWREDFPLTPFWQSMRERFMPPVVIERLPPSLLERFIAGEMSDRLTQALRFIATSNPLSSHRWSTAPFPELRGFRSPSTIRDPSCRPASGDSSKIPKSSAIARQNSGSRTPARIRCADIDRLREKHALLRSQSQALRKTGSVTVVEPGGEPVGGRNK